jgi:hypothetical protein
MKRKRPLKRSPMPPRKSWMPRVSEKRKAIRKAVSPKEQEFLEQFKTCVYCGQRPATGIDHIARGSSRARALTERTAWNASCWECNAGDANDHGKFPIERKLAVKLTTDGEFFDLDTFNAIRGRGAGAITLADVSAWLEWR